MNVPGGGSTHFLVAARRSIQPGKHGRAY